MILTTSSRQNFAYFHYQIDQSIKLPNNHNRTVTLIFENGKFKEVQTVLMEDTKSYRHRRYFWQVLGAIEAEIVRIESLLAGEIPRPQVLNNDDINGLMTEPDFVKKVRFVEHVRQFVISPADGDALHVETVEGHMMAFVDNDRWTTVDKVTVKQLKEAKFIYLHTHRNSKPPQQPYDIVLLSEEDIRNL